MTPSIFAPIFALLVNVSIIQATLPTKHKRAIIPPRVKKQGLDPTDPASYRPISNLSFISKLVERVIHKQLSDYVESHHLLPPTHSGFRRHHSTETAVIINLQRHRLWFHRRATLIGFLCRL